MCDSGLLVKCRETDTVQVIDLCALRAGQPKVLFVDRMPVEGTIAYLLSSVNCEGQIMVQGVMAANSFDKIGKHLQEIPAEIFVDLDLIDLVPNAFVAKACLFNEEHSDALKDFFLSEAWLKTLIE